MQASDIPTKISQFFANAAGGGFVRDIPDVAQPAGAASYATGFPPENFNPVGAGGIPPWGEDMNGILRAITRWNRWMNAGGMVQYDAGFSATVGGYPAGSFLLNAGGTGFWLSVEDNNVSNPDAAGAGWVAFVASPSDEEPLIEGIGVPGSSLAYSREDHVHPNNYGGTSSGTANAQVISAPNGLIALTSGISVSFKVGAGLSNVGATTLTVGALAATPVVKDSPAGPIPLTGGEITAGNVVEVRFGTTSFHLVTPALGSAAAANATSLTGRVVALSGSSAVGNIPVFSATDGTVLDSGVSPGSLAGSAESVLYQLGLTF